MTGKHIGQILFVINLTVFFTCGYTQENTTGPLARQINKLDSLKKTLASATDSLEVARLCQEIYRYTKYDLLRQNLNEGENLIRALRIYESNEKWDDAADVYNDLGGIYFNQKQYSVARKYWNLAKEQFKRSNDIRRGAASFNNLSLTYINDSSTQAQNLMKAYLDSAIILYKVQGDPAFLMAPYENLGEWYRKKHDLKSAEKYTKLSLSIAQKENDLSTLQSGTFQLGKIKKEQGHINRAIQLIEKSMTYHGIRKTDPNHTDALLELSELYSSIGNYEKAYFYQKTYQQYSDTLFHREQAKALLDLEMLYETEKRDLKIKTQESDIALLAEQDKLKSQWMIFGMIGLVTLFGFILLIRSRGHFKKQKQLQENFAQSLIQAQEDERTRISRELHDSVGQQLTLIKKKAQNEDQNEFSELTNTALEEVRSISRALYPASLKQLGLSESIEQLLYELDEEVDMFFSVDIEDINNELDEEKTLNFYRFIQESVNNAIKHSKAKTLEVRVSKGKGTIEVFIKDNGCGFENVDQLQSNSLGLKTMAERIRILRGTLSIRSRKGEGTVVMAKIPV
ncbi:sensor histidine kinase [Fulvivirga sp. M361]|uniref:tetratricopeptide repeat-containing sensor histidine kinase n=1 Tax=Fulvivirga sp. M361 TaxID=2594266 RepID=UPI001624E7A9|nr:sensor histidine kinase [Fulvivirga sp. M361]